MMREDCKEAARGVLGKSATEAQLRNIEEGIRAHKMALARKDPLAWRALSEKQRVQLATESRIKELKAKTTDAKQASQLQAEKQIRTWQSVLEQKRPEISHQQALGEYITNVGEVKIAGEQANFYHSFKSGLTAFAPKWFGFMADNLVIRDMAREAYGQNTGNTLAKKVAEELRSLGINAIERMRKAGRSIGQLDYGHLPQTWSGEKLRNLEHAGKMSRDQFAEEFANKLMLRHYIREDGDIMSEDERKDFLRNAYDTITTDGVMKIDPDVYHRGSRTPKFAHTRQIHFADGDTYLDAMSKYSDGPFISRLRSHINSLAREVALVEEMGPNPERNFSFLENMAQRQDKGIHHPMDGALARMMGLTPRDVWDRMTGKTEITKAPKRARGWQMVRNIASSINFAGVLPQQVSDLAGIFQTAGFNHAPPLRMIGAGLKGLLPGMRKRLMADGFGLAHSFSEMGAYYQEDRTDNFTGRLAAFVQRIGLTHGWASSLHKGLQVGLASDLAEQSRKPWDELSSEDQRRLTFQGVRKENWEVWRAAGPEQWGKDNPMLTPDTVAAVPQERIQPIIQDRINELRQGYQDQINELNKRDVQDNDWIEDRLLSLQNWIQKSNDKLQESINRHGARKDDALKGISRDLGSLYDKIDTAKTFWRTATERKTNINKLHKLGVSEGMATSALKSVFSQMKEVTPYFEQLKGQLEHDFSVKWFKEEQKLQARLDAGKEYQPYLIKNFRDLFAKANERVTERLAKAGKQEAAQLGKLKVKFDSLSAAIEGYQKAFDVAEASKLKITEVRDAGNREGKVIKDIQAAHAKINDTVRAAEQKHTALLKDWFSRWSDREQDFSEFEQRATDRTQRRAYVVDRLGDEQEQGVQRIQDQTRHDAVRTLLGFLERESKSAVHQGANLGPQAMVSKTGRPGELTREAAQSFGFFGKSYIYSYMARMIQRANFQPTAMGRIQSHLSLWVGMALMSAVSEQLIALAHGNDPEPMVGKNAAKFWIGTIGRVGFSIWFDVFRELYYGMKYLNESKSDVFAALAGPLGSDVNNLAQVATDLFGKTGLAGQRFKQKANKELPQSAYRFLKGVIPQPFLNAPYAQALSQHLLYDQIQNAVNPGAVARTKMRMQQDGQGSWIDQGRPPNFGTALGAHP